MVVRRALVSGLATFLLAPGAVAAAERSAVARDVRAVTPPVLAGPHVLWGERDTDGALVVRAARGSGARALFRFAPPARRTRLAFGALDASPTHVAFVRTAATGPTGPVGVQIDQAAGTVVAPPAGGRSVSLVAGPLGGPFVVLSGRPGARATSRGCRAGQVSPQEIAVSGSRVLWTESVTSCARTGELVTDRLVVRDLRAEARPPRELARSLAYDPGVEPPFTFSSPRLTGRFAAYQRERPADAITTGVVIDLERGGRRLERGNLLEEFAVAGDGALVTSTHSPDGSHRLTLRAADRGGAAPVALGPLGGGFGGPEEGIGHVATGGGRIAFVRVTDRPRLVIADRAGRARPVTTFGPSHRMTTGFDFDGRRVVWATTRRGRSTIWSARAP